MPRLAPTLLLVIGLLPACGPSHPDCSKANQVEVTASRNGMRWPLACPDPMASVLSLSINGGSPIMVDLCSGQHVDMNAWTGQTVQLKAQVLDATGKVVAMVEETATIPTPSETGDFQCTTGSLEIPFP
jgi:hypothetical protein